MTSQNWGNNDPSRQHQPTPSTASEPFSYFRLYLTIVAAIITSFFIMGIVSILFSAALLNAFTADLRAETSLLSQPKPQHSQVLQKDLQQLANKSIQQVAEPLQQRAVQLNKQAQQQSSAKKSDIQTCNFWLQQYQNEKSDRNKMHVNSACKRAHGKLWNDVK